VGICCFALPRSVLTNVLASGAEAARLHRGRKDRTQEITIYPMAACFRLGLGDRNLELERASDRRPK
jgi:hypothetical protein